MREIDVSSPEDVLNGTPGDDHLVGGSGNDTIDGGDGDDVIYDGGGSNTLRGGGGNDHITLVNYPGTNATDTGSSVNVIDAGDGDDYVIVSNGRTGTLSIDLGAGDDSLVIIGSLSATAITLGAGHDRVTFSGAIGNDIRQGAVSFTINDFVAGAGGDILNVGDLVQVAFASSQLQPSFDSPFLGGFLTLVQDGADTVLRIDFDGNGPGAARDIVRLHNVIASQITAENLAGYAPNGGAPVPETYYGTEHADTIETSVVGGHYYGLGGDDEIIGQRSNDVLDGGAGNDHLVGGEGDDWMIGGDGNDVLADSAGNDRFDGGAGEDVIDIVRSSYQGGTAPDVLTIYGGDGDDSVTIDYVRELYTNARSATFTADLGAGNDYIYIAHARTNGTLTLGAGQDRVALGDLYFDFGGGTTTITDFVAGAGGDVLDVSSALLGMSNYDPTKNPLTTGYLRLVQQGADTIVAFDYDGANGSDTLMTLFRLMNVDASKLTAENLNGYGSDGSIQNLTISGTVGNDKLWGGVGADHLNGGDGNDAISGGAGSDIIDGGTGDDSLEGGFGNDQLLGGIGNDLIQDTAGGSDTLNGGDGDDHIVVNHLFNSNVSEAITIDAGAGDDDVTFTTVAPGALAVDLGTGNDRILLRTLPAGGTTLTLGAGSDVVVLDQGLASQTRGSVKITDFQAGDSGDRLDWLSLYYQMINNGDTASNPFALGKAHLVQSGSDVLLKIDAPGPITLVTFVNTSLSAFTNFNFGVDIHATPPDTSDTITGTAGDDVLHGTAGADIISGLAGDDQLYGEGGNDVLHGGDGKDMLYGGTGDDTLDGGAGRDTVDGGDGNDVITDITGEDVITGGAGNDTISVKVGPDAFNGVGSLDAGDGDDLVTIFDDAYAAYTAAMGAGDDTVSITALYNNLTLSLGAGRDTVRFDSYGPGNSSILTVTDFQAGNGGDRVDFRSMLNHMLTFLSGDIPADQDPFALGFVRLVQAGNDVVLYFDLARVPGGLYEYAIARFQGTTVAQFTADNFVNADPAAAGVAAPHAVINNMTIAAGQVEVATNVSPHFVYLGSGNGNVKFVNHGVVTTTATTGNDAVGFLVSYGDSIVSAASLFDNAADGVFRVTTSGPAVNGLTDGRVYGFYAPGSYVRFANEGLFEVTAAGGTAWGVLTGYSTLGLAHVNSGTINVTSGYDAYGVQFAGFDGTFTNNGAINVHGDDFAIGIYSDQYNGDRIVNNGTITVSTGPTSDYASIGMLLFETNSRIAYNYLNTGTITADIAFAVTTGLNVTHIADTLVNTGTINGSIILGAGNDVVRNSGSISGRTLLGADNDLYDGRNGTHSGSIEGGDGNDVLIGGNGAETLYGDEGADQISGGGGDDFIDGGQGGDALDGGAGFDTLSYYESLGTVTINLTAGTAISAGETDYIRNFEEVIGSRGNDTIIGSVGADILLGASGDDHISGGGGSDILLGNTGNDVLSGGAGNDRFLFQAGDGHDEITDVAAGDSIEIYGLKAAQSITQVGADVLITLNANDSILVRKASVAAVNSNYLHFITTPLDINLPAITDHPIHVAQDMLISDGVSYSFGDVDPSSILVSRATTVSSFIAVEFVNLDKAVSLWNAGHIAFHTAAVGSLTIGLGRGSEMFVNHGSGEIDVTADHTDAFGTFGVQSVYNEGTISVTSLSGNATGAYDLDGSDSATFVNSGHIDVTAATMAQGVAQAPTTSAGPTGYFNSGSITVHGGTASIGAAVNFQAHPAVQQPYFVNSGTISVTDNTTAIDSVGLQVNMMSSPSVWNSGTITGDIALQVSQSGSFDTSGPKSHVYNSGTLTGLVNLSTYDDVLVNTGTVNGAINLGGGNDAYDGRLGTLTGNVDGYDGNDIILAGVGNQHLFGGNGDDYLSGGAGVDLLTGGMGRDTFRFDTGFGADEVTDFEAGAAHDYISIGGYSAFQSLAQSGQDVLITFSASDSLLIRNATVADVSTALSFGAASLAAYTIPAAPIAPVAPADPAAVVNTLTFLPIIGTETDDTLIGDIGPDDLRGLGGKDTLTGGAGNDMLNGGQGFDTAIFSGNRAQYTIHANSDGSVTVADTRSGSPDGIDTLFGIERLQFHDVSLVLATGLDLNGDDVGDVLFRSVSGGFASWHLGNTSIAGGGNIGNPGSGFLLAGLGDFNGDGTSDLLFRGRDGTLASWQVAGTAITGGGNIGNPGVAYALVGTGDFNGDGTSDLLFLNGLTGAYATWDLSGTAITGGGTIGNPGAGYVYKATGDFNGDGKSDVLFENANGGYAIWTLDDAKISGGGNLGNPGSSWFFKGVGDFNGDGKSDVLFENADGSYATWDLNGSAIIGGGTIGNPGAAWSFAGIGDYNGDGKSDIVFRGANGTLATWTMNDTAITGGGNLGDPGSSFAVANGHGANSFATLLFQGTDGTVATWQINAGVIVGGGTLGNPGAGWTAKAVVDFAGTGESDVLFQYSDGTLATWHSDGAHFISGSALGNAGAGYTFKGVGDFNGDGKSDILFQNNATGVYATWDVSGNAIIGGGDIGVASGYSFVATGDLNGDGKADMVFKDASGTYAAWLLSDTAIISGGTIGNPGAGWTFKALADLNGDGKADMLFQNVNGNYASWDMDGNAIIGGGDIGNPGDGFTLAKVFDINGDGKADLVFEHAGSYAAWLMDDTHILQGNTLGNANTSLHVV